MSQPVTARRLGLYLVKALPALALLFLLLLTIRPAQAQGRWYPYPCDAKGNLLSNPSPDRNGFYSMGGTFSGTAGNTYPKPMIASALAKAPGWPYLSAGYPLALQIIPATPTPGSAYAANYFGDPAQYCPYVYWVDPSFGSPTAGYVNGGVTMHLSGQLVYFFKEMWQTNPYVPPTPPTPMPDHLNLLLRTWVSASASASYGSSAQQWGLAALATATDGPPFNETASASAGDAPATSGPASVIGYHLVTAAVDPNTGIAQVYLNGTLDRQAIDGVPFGSMTSPDFYQASPIRTNGPTQASAGGSVAAAVKQDNRAVTISTELGQTYHKSTIHFDSGGTALKAPNVLDGSGTLTDDTIKSAGAGDNAIITYIANVTGTWGRLNPEVDATYLWHLNYGAGNAFPSGTFFLPSDPPYDYLGQFGSNVSGPAHCSILLTDVDGASASANHYLNWHDPVEHWQPSGSNVQDTPTSCGSSSGPQPANGFVNIVVPPGDVECSVGPATGEFITLSAHVAEALDAPVDPLVLALMLTTGYTMGLGDPPPPQIYPLQGTQDQFQKDVATQENELAGTTNGVFMPNIARMNQSFADTVYASGNYVGYFNGGTLSNSGPQGTLTFNTAAYQLRWRQNYLGDGYDLHGYTGSVPGHISWPGSIQYVYDWTWSAATGNPGG